MRSIQGLRKCSGRKVKNWWEVFLVFLTTAMNRLLQESCEMRLSSAGVLGDPILAGRLGKV